MDSCLSRNPAPTDPTTRERAPARLGVVPDPVFPQHGPMKPGTLTLAALFEAEESALLRFAIGLVGKRPVAEELVQEAFLRLHQAWEGVDNPRAWLYRSLRNLALNHLRDHARETSMEEESMASGDALAAEILGRNEAVGMVRLLLAEMTDDDRNLIELKYRDNLKY